MEGTKQVTRSVRPLKRTYALLGKSLRNLGQISGILIAVLDINDVPCVPTLQPPVPVDSGEARFMQLLQLDSSIRPGLTETHFRALFARCTCGLITTRRAFNAHYCKDVAVDDDVIDLTDVE